MGHLLRRVFVAAAIGLALVSSASAKAPNVVFILADDLDAATAAELPQVKSLITDRGTRFRRHYVSLSLCCPSRVSGLRGQFAHNTTIFKNSPPEGGFEAVYNLGLEQSTLATWLQGAGYRTALFGKYLNNYPTGAPSARYIPPGWDEWMSAVAGTPYKGFNYTMNHNGNLVTYGKSANDYLTDVISREAADFIRRSVDDFDDKPFFLYLAPFAPHSPATPAPRHENAFPGIKAPRPLSFNEFDVSDKPSWVRALPRLSDTQIADIDKLYRKRRQALLAVDEMVQNIVSTLQSRGELENTFIFFASDNGYHQGQHRLDSGKMTAYEEDILIPLSVRGPGVPANRAIDHITANVDYAGTIAELAGVPTPGFVDGRSLVPFLKGQTPPSWRAALLIENKSGAIPPLRGDDGPQEPSDPLERGWWARGNGDDIDGFTGLRVNDGTTYVEYVTNEFELYNNLTDQFQTSNAYNNTPPHVRARLANWVAALKTASGAALRQAEQAPPSR